MNAPIRQLEAEQPQQIAARLEALYSKASAEQVIRAAIDEFGDGFALVSSFGSQSAVLLHVAASVSKDIPIVFLDTGKLFGETKRYMTTLVETLGLTNVIVKKPDEKDLNTHDPKGALWTQNTSSCCFIRKVVPLKDALADFTAWGSGRKRYQGATREALPHFEASDGKVKVNPLAHWSSDELSAYMEFHGLPTHPLVAEGFKSIGCMPCTDKVAAGEDERAGRWRGLTKTECGIHLSYSENAKLASLASSGL